MLKSLKNFAFSSLRVQGNVILNKLSKKLAGECLVSPKHAQSIFNGSAIQPENKNSGYLILVHVGSDSLHQHSVITVAQVWGETSWPNQTRRADVIRISSSKNNDIHELIATINECLADYPNATVLINAYGAGSGLAQNLTSLGIYYKEIHWGGPCFVRLNKNEYVNRRSQAYLGLDGAIRQGRFKIKANIDQQSVIKELCQIHYKFDKENRWNVLSIADHKEKGICITGLIETFAYIYLEGISYLTV